MAIENVQTVTSQFGEDTLAFWMYGSLLERADKLLVATKYGMPIKLPAQMGDTVRLVRYNDPGLPLESLSEGITPDGQDMSITTVEAQVDQWGGYFTLSDKAILQVSHGPFEQAVKLSGEQYARTRDRECLRVLERGTNKYYEGAATSRATLTATSYPQTTDIYEIVEALRAEGAMEYDGGDFVAITDTANEMDFLQDTTFATAATMQNMAPLERGEFKRWGGLKFVRTNQLASYRLDTNNNGTTVDDQANTGSAVDLTDGVYTVVVVGCDRHGQEVTSGASQSATLSGDVLRVVTPAFPSSPFAITSFNLYVSSAGGGITTATLQKRGAAASTTYFVVTSGAQATGTSIVYTSTGQVVQAIPPASVVIHKVIVFGREAYACTELGGVIPTRTRPTTDTETTDSDPLGQRRKVGWKAYWKDAITNNDWLAVLECTSRYAGYVTH